MGEQHFNKRHWHHNTFSEMYNDDTLWVYMIRVTEEIQVADHEKVKDPVLRCLIAMGAWDWDKKDSTELQQATRVMRFSTALASCLLLRILSREAKVVKHHLSIKTKLMIRL